MTDTVKLIIDIPVRILDTIQADQMISREQLVVLQTHIQNGVPLDDVKAEIMDKAIIEAKSGDGFIFLGRLLRIFDNLGKESEE